MDFDVMLPSDKWNSSYVKLGPPAGDPVTVPE